ncbi:EAL domain-containing protein [Paenibacillus sp. CF384]|uniref:bifunctional diguanylate cyclase/phosphodiesterase n=1 Tax=Paenibacillus sp. CF384 TaxID=1884382 RepID=UPI00089759F0|nr:EAL domain-containing protein [Paenibacillus sp. CF384]SDX88521.1 diguanylate cyclase (GGDEF) domain-containing protein [Paenibacillus sp. CF384]
MKWNSIKFMSTALILSLGMVVILAFGHTSFNNTKSNFKQSYFKESQLKLEQAQLQFENLIRGANQFLAQFSQTDDAMNAATVTDPSRLKFLLQTVQQTILNSSSVKLGLANGTLYSGPSAAMPASYDPREQMWYVLGDRSVTKPIWTEPYLDYLNQKIIITASRTIWSHSGEPIGVLAVDFDLSSISGYIGGSKIGTQGFVMLLSPSGTILADTDNFAIGEKPFGDRFAAIATNAQVKPIAYSFKGKPYYIKLNLVRENGMAVVTGVSMKEIDEHVWAVLFPVFLTGFICLALFGLVTYYFVLKGIAPLQRLVSLMKSVEHGDYSVHATIQTYEEIRSLSQSFNLMTEGLSKRDEELSASNEKIYRLAYFDSLTGLLNRRHLLETTTDALSGNPELGIAVIYVDLDNFKFINDTLGHSAGDQVLVEVASRLEAIAYSDKYASRIGGDEFIVVLHNVENRGVVEEALQQLILSLELPIYHQKQICNVSASLGVSFYPEHGATMEELLQKADMAMYQSKAKGKNQYCVFDKSIQLQITEKAYIERSIKEALRNHQFELYYQPIYDCAEGCITSVETLLRCNSPALLGIPTQTIIETAEQTGLIIPLDKWVLEEACRFAGKLNAGRSRSIRVTVNVSANDIAQQGFVQQVEDALSRNQLNPDWLGLELTETVLINSFEGSRSKLEALKEIGVRIYLDDFGTGYSSLNYLKLLPIDYVKIDKSFVISMLQSDRDGLFMKTLVELTHTIDLKVVAEGVETAEQERMLLHYQCDMLQGYHIGRPRNEENMLRDLYPELEVESLQNL